MHVFVLYIPQVSLILLLLTTVAAVTDLNLDNTSDFVLFTFIVATTYVTFAFLSFSDGGGSCYITIFYIINFSSELFIISFKYSFILSQLREINSLPSYSCLLLTIHFLTLVLSFLILSPSYIYPSEGRLPIFFHLRNLITALPDTGVLVTERSKDERV